jgi:hypothetical protein
VNELSGTEADISWFASNSLTDCGQSCTIVSNASPGGAVSLNYRKVSFAFPVSVVWRHAEFVLALPSIGEYG